jgi:hypothetical protein
MIFLEKKGLKFFKKSLRATEFYEKMGQKEHRSLFFLTFNSKFSHFDMNINLNIPVSGRFFLFLFCISLLPLSIELRDAKGFLTGPLNSRNIKVTHLF